MKSTKIIALLLVALMCFSVLASCKKDPVNPGPTGPQYTPIDLDSVKLGDKQAEYNTTTSVMPSNWNEFTYADNNDTQIMSYITSTFFTYDYKFENDQKYNADGTINYDGIVDGAFTTNYDAATKLEDVTSAVDAKWGYTAEQKEEGGYAWKITLRNDLKWDDGTAITAADFVYSMKQLLDPDFMNMRANTYYDTLKIKNSREYFFSGAPIYAPIVPAYGDGETPDYSFDMEANQVYMNTTSLEMTLAGYSLEELIVDYVGTEKALAALAAIEEDKNEFGYTPITAENMEVAMELVGYAIAPFGLDWSTFDDAAKKELFMETLFYISGYGDEVAWETVGIYEVEGENAFVICLDKAYSFLNEDGSLSVWAAYYMSGLPVVHQAKYEASKKAPAPGATLWTSNYNSSLETTASWGPYKLVEFEAGSHYRLEKNPNWFGWNMEEYKNQYNITAINCRKIESQETQWMGFLKGEYDDSALYTFNVNEYLDSKYVSYSEGSTGTFGMQLFSDLETLKKSENNNGILAIADFRQALNLGLNRSDVIEKIWPGTTTPCFGLVNVAYYYDIEGAANLADGGKYRNSVQAKEGILRAYGYTQSADGKWSINDLAGMTLDEAYETLTGYNLTLAKEKMAAAIAELTANADKYGYDSSKNITLVYGSSSDSAQQRFRATYLQGVVDTLVEGTALQGKIEVKFDASAGSKWAEAFRSGKTQIGFGYGFSGNAFNPFDIIGAFVNPDDSLNYHEYWDTSVIDMTLTMPAGDYAGAGETITMSIQNWYYCLNGLAAENEAPVQYNWDAGFAPNEARLMILSALEEAVIKESRSVMLIADAGGSFLGAKFDNFSDSYNTFMGFGGIRYMVVKYNDAEWAEYVNYVCYYNTDLSSEYKKTE